MFDRTALQLLPLSTRRNRVRLPGAAVEPECEPSPLAEREVETGVRELAEAVRAARGAGRPRVLAFGAHLVKNGLAPVLIRLIEDGWFTALATNGAAIIHDWELAYQGETSEDVQDGVQHGRFGLWEETGRFLNLALLLGAYRGLGYGESVGAMIHDNGLTIPTEQALRESVLERLDSEPAEAGAACDLLEIVRSFEIKPGTVAIEHRFREYSIQAAAYRLGVPFTAHPMFGHDIIYTHPLNRGAAVGRTAERDFLRFADSIAAIESGVYLSVGSAVMSPMIFEKSFSMAMNRALQAGRPITNHQIYVVDLAQSSWDWRSDGEPPSDNPAYYLRFLKTFSRMGGRMRYLYGDNRRILPRLYYLLSAEHSSVS